MRAALSLVVVTATACAVSGMPFLNVSAPEGYLKGIDVSVYQGNINWADVKTSGISFAM